jgi:lipopolysaccharide transport system permease protein
VIETEESRTHGLASGSDETNGICTVNIEVTGMRGVSSQFSPIIIRASTGWVSLRLADLWDYRGLLYFLAWRDLKIRYKQTILGVTWVVLQPSFLTLAFSIFFGKLGGIPSDGIPYPAFVLCGLLPWQLFANTLIYSSNSLVANERLIIKVYFPRLVIPLSAAVVALVDFFITLVVLFAIMTYYGIVPIFAVWTLPGFVLLAVAIAFGAGLWFSALNLEYRDVRYTIPFIIQFWFFISPVVYPSSLVSETWRLIYSLNPMAGVIEGFRWALLGKNPVSGSSLAISILAALVLLIGGVYYFRRMERTFADVV